MGIIDNILSKVNLKYEDLTSAERDTLHKWTEVLDSNQLTVDVVETYVRRMRDAVENELQGLKESPQSWVGVVSLFVPFYGLIKKWYYDQHRVYLEARLRNLILLEAFLISPKKAREALDKAIAGLVSTRK